MAEIASPWMTREQAARYAGVREQVIYSLCATGALKSYLPLGAKPDSRRRVVFAGDVDELIKERVVKAPYSALVAAGVADVFAKVPDGRCA